MLDTATELRNMCLFLQPRPSPYQRCPCTHRRDEQIRQWLQGQGQWRMLRRGGAEVDQDQ